MSARLLLCLALTWVAAAATLPYAAFLVRKTTG